ncbi:MAG: dynamin family protein [Pseudomonadota bacterium]
MSIGENNWTPSEKVKLKVSRVDTFGRGLDELHALKNEFADLKDSLSDIASISGPESAKKLSRMSAELDNFAPEVTFIGQIKSGKTTLVNAMAGQKDLLPSDVNPWTSVVTSLHLNSRRNKDLPKAEFQFFDSGEWDKLVENGGRIGELSSRTGADKEQEKLLKQVAEMREMSKARLGKKFELLLGQTHKYQEYDEALIKRYVCLGDDFGGEVDPSRQGQFADITKSAEIYLNADFLPCNFVLRDTPGLNDTFMMREQITIRAIRDSQTCVVVLSAHQALNSVDMGLIRLISTIKSRQVLIFVNRIDELSDPVNQIEEIRSSLVETLKANSGPQDATILFGSAVWANCALSADMSEMSKDSLAALQAIIKAENSVEYDEDADWERMAWHASGVPALYSTLSARIAESSGQRLLQSVRRRARNMVLGLRATSSIVSVSANSANIRKLSDQEIVALFSSIESKAQRELSEMLNVARSHFNTRIEQAHSRFLSRAADALVQHLDNYGEGANWNYTPDGLRTLMRSSYQIMSTRLRKNMEVFLDGCAVDLADAYNQIFDVTLENFKVETPAVPDVPPPVTIAQTIVLDVKTPWWKSWSRNRKGYGAFAEDFRKLIEAETGPMVNELKVDQIDDIEELMTATLKRFLVEQQTILADILEKSKVSLEDLHGLFGVASQQERNELFDILFEELDIEETGEE